MATALITGITGQDGWYLTEHLRSEGYTVHGLIRPGERAPADVQAHEADLEDFPAITRAMAAARPHECYHLAAQTFVMGEEFSTMRTNVDGTLHVLEAVRREVPGCRLFLAGSSEMFGDVEVSPQNESTPFRPRNIYGVSKLAAYHLMRVYREQHDLYGCCGILYNHESPRRGSQFVTRKITQAAARIKLGKQSGVRLGNLDAVRDWGHARDYVRAMWLMLQQDKPDDYVLATGQGRKVREFVEAAFGAVELDWRQHLQTAPEFFRPAEKVPFIGDATKARENLGWSARTEFSTLVSEMVEQDLMREKIA